MNRAERRTEGTLSWAKFGGNMIVIGAFIVLSLSVPVGAQAPLPVIPVGTPTAVPPIVVGTPIAVSTPETMELTGTVTTFYPRVGGLSTEPAALDERGVSRVAYAPDGRMLAAGTPFGSDLFSVSATAGVQCLDYINSGAAVTALAFSPDGATLASGTFTDTVQLWDVGSGRLMASLVATQGTVNGVAFSPDGAMVAAAGSDGAVRVWQTRDERLLRTLKGHAGAVLSLDFSPDGRSLVSGGADGKVLVWQLSSGVSMSSLIGNVGGAPAVAFGPTGNLVGLGSGDGVVRIWDLKAGKLVQTWTGHHGAVTAVSFSPDGGRLASASYDGSVLLRRVADGETLSAFHGTTALGALAFSPDGTLLVTGALDGAVQIWAVGRPTVQVGTPIVIATPVPTAAPCMDDVTFVADVTLPDNSVVARGGLLNKTWRVRNSGTCAWGAGYQIAFAGGSQMNAEPAVPLPQAAPGEVVDVTIPMYAPVSPGTYNGVWQFENPSGEVFGVRVTVRVVVPAPATATPAFGMNIAASAVDVNAGDSVTIRASVHGVKAAWLDGQPITNDYREETLQLCEDQTFTLDAQLKDGQHRHQTVTVNVRGGCDRRADIVMKSLSADHTTVHKGQIVHFSARMKNEGQRDANNFAVGWDPGNGAGFIIVAADLDVDHGDDRTVTWTYAYPATGSFHSRVRGDYYNDVDESDRSNNEKGLTLKIIP